MQALVRVQARVRARRVRLSLESQTEQQKLQQQLVNEARVREIEVSSTIPIFCFINMEYFCLFHDFYFFYLELSIEKLSFIDST